MTVCDHFEEIFRRNWTVNRAVGTGLTCYPNTADGTHAHRIVATLCVANSHKDLKQYSWEELK